VHARQNGRRAAVRTARPPGRHTTGRHPIRVSPPRRPAR